MTDSNKFEEMLEHLVNEDREKAAELFHEIVVEKSRDIYESLLEDEEVEETTDEEVDEATDEEVDENFVDEITPEAEDDMGGDAADDMMADIAADGEEGDESDDEDIEDVEDIEINITSEPESES